MLFKYHAACYGTHETIENILALRGARPAAEAVESIDLHVPPGHLAMCNIQAPTTPLEGKFSLRFTAAMALADGDLSDRAFTEARVHDPGFIALRDRVAVLPHEGDHFEGGSEAVVRLRDGSELRRRCNLNIPATDLDRQWAKLVTKFRSLATPVVGAEASERLVERVAAFETLQSVNEIVALAVKRSPVPEPARPEPGRRVEGPAGSGRERHSRLRQVAQGQPLRGVHRRPGVPAPLGPHHQRGATTASSRR